jgi:hypothetical protein
LHNAGIGTEPDGERKVTGPREGAPIIDTVKGRKVAFDVELVIKNPVNLCSPLL